MEQNRYSEQCRKSLWKFQVMKKVEWRPRTILVSEALAVCAMCDLYDVNTFVESGVANARSTQIWAGYDNRRLDVWAIDKVLKKTAIDAMSTYQNARLIRADGNIEVLNQITRFAPCIERRLGVFIDGPKGLQAVKLAMNAIKIPCVKFVGVHDCHKIDSRTGNLNAARTAMEAAGAAFFTDEPWFTDEYKYIDEGETQFDEEQQGWWEPGFRCFKKSGTISRRNLGSYGPTAGFLIKEEPQ